MDVNNAMAIGLLPNTDKNKYIMSSQVNYIGLITCILS